MGWSLAPFNINVRNWTVLNRRGRTPIFTGGRTKCSHTIQWYILVFLQEERIYTQNRLPLFIDFPSTDAAAAKLRHHLGNLMPAQKRPLGSSSPPPSPSPPPDAEKGDDSPQGSENHNEEQPENASGACLIMSRCSRRWTCIMLDTPNSSFIQHFCSRFLALRCLVNFFLPRDWLPDSDSSSTSSDGEKDE